MFSQIFALGIAPPGAMTLLHDKMDISSVPENDSLGMVMQYIVKALTGQVAAYLEFYEFMVAILACSPMKIHIDNHLKAIMMMIAFIVALVLALYILFLVAEYLISLFSDKRYALYYGALAKTLTPVFALAMIYMTLVILPFLNWREADLISKDKIMYGQPKMFTHAEHRVVQKLKSEMLKALE